MTIDVSKEEFEFLKDLQHELLTQTNDGNADPVYWGVMETREVPVPDGFGGEVKFMFGGCERDYSKEEFIEYIQEQVIAGDPKLQEEWESVDTYFDEEIVDFYNKHSDSGDAYTVESREQDYLSRDTGCFLTKRACKEYIARFGYNHRNPHTYAMTAYRNNEYWRLLQILKTMDLREEPLTEEEVEQKAKEYSDQFDAESCNAEITAYNAFIAGAHLKGMNGFWGRNCFKLQEKLKELSHPWVKVEERYPDEDENDKSVSKPVLVKNEYGLCTTARYQYAGHFWMLEYGEINGWNVIHSKVVEWMDIPGDNKD